MRFFQVLFYERDDEIGRVEWGAKMGVYIRYDRSPFGVFALSSPMVLV
jgi:hypothetical protein